MKIRVSSFSVTGFLFEVFVAICLILFVRALFIS